MVTTSAPRSARRRRAATFLVAVAVALAGALLPGPPAAAAAPAWGWTGDGAYGAVDHGESADQTFTLSKKLLEGPVEISVTGSTDFTLTRNDCQPWLKVFLATTCSVTVTFAPSTCGEQSGTLVATGKQDSDEVALSGHQTTPSAACPFVHVSASGSDDTGDGTASAPLATLDAALATAANLSAATTIRMAGGSYSGAHGWVQVSGPAYDGLTIRGGFEDSTWTQSDEVETVLTGSPQAVLASRVDDLTLADLALNATAPPAPGSSVYGLREVAASVVLRDVVIETSNARPGVDGTDGSAGSPGADGSSGASWSGPGICTVQSGGAGGTGLNGGGDGGFGRCGDGGWGLRGGGYLGGAGGSGGQEPAERGGSGQRGAAGDDGFAGSGGRGSYAGEAWYGAHGTHGGPGQLGSGGGGGGAGGGDAGGFFRWAHSGGGGGGGGAGGRGGAGGHGGTAGGGAFGILLHGQSSVDLQGVAITVGNGGHGGHGGLGGPGGRGGYGGSGGDGSVQSVSCGATCYGGPGGRGGDGGAGGRGGSGGGGAGGPSVGVYRTGGDSAVTRDDATTITHGAGGSGGWGQHPSARGENGLAAALR